MSNTTDLTMADGNWTAVSSDPVAITIKSNSIGNWHLAIKDTVGAPAGGLIGELLRDEMTWEAGAITGTLYIRGNAGMQFAVTE